MHADGPTIRGNERQVLRVAVGLRERGHDIVASCRSGGPVEAAFRAAGIATTGVRPGGDADLYHALRFAAWLRGERPDAALLTSWNRAFVAAWAARVARVPRIVLRLGAVQEIRPFRGFLERLAMERWYHAVIANSDAVRDQVVRAAPGIRPERVHLVRNGVTVPVAQPAPLRAELGLPEGAPVAVAVGTWEPRKGFADLLAAAPRMSAGLHLALVGGGDPARGAALRSTAAGLGVAGRVHFLGHRHDVPALLAAADLVVLPSRSEGLSVAMLEAMAAGRPIVATDIGGVRDALGARDGRAAAGWIVPPRDPEALAAAVSTVLGAVRGGSPEVARATAEARWRMHERFSEERMLDGYEAVLRGEGAS